jgi:hypothetical protein
MQARCLTLGNGVAAIHCGLPHGEDICWEGVEGKMEGACGIGIGNPSNA